MVCLIAFIHVAFPGRRGIYKPVKAIHLNFLCVYRKLLKNNSFAILQKHFSSRGEVQKLF